jgi:protein ImuB
MFVWLPNFAMTRARLKQPPLAKPREPLVLLEKNRIIKRIAALDEPAIHAGLHLHQPLADALAVFPALVHADAEPVADAAALKALVTWAQRYSPATAPAAASGIWLDLTGCTHLFGGEERLAEDLLSRLEARGIPARAAIAPTWGAAYALAHHAESYSIVPSGLKSPLTPSGRGGNSELAALLAPLPVERLRICEETASILRKLGLFTIGHVQHLPRTGLARRFPDLLPQLDKAMGLAEETIDFLRQPTPWIERLRFAEPISALEDLERVTAKLLDMLCFRLQEARQGGMRFELSFFRCDGDVQSQIVSTALPARESLRIFRLFREKLGLIDPGFGIDAAMLAAIRVEPLEARQTKFVAPAQTAVCVEELAALIDALENRLGEGRVYRLAPHESYLPERAFKKQTIIPETSKALSGILQNAAPRARKDRGYRKAGSGMTRAIEQDKTVWRSMGERPIRLFARPQPIDVTAALPDAPPMLFRWRKVLHRIDRADGPERISPEWWQGGLTDEARQTRDYYRVESRQGLRFWVFREGLYGGDYLPRWFLHGVFA